MLDVDELDRLAVAIVTARTADDDAAQIELIMDVLETPHGQVDLVRLVARLAALSSFITKGAAALLGVEPAALIQKYAVALAAAQQPPQPQAGE